MRRNLSVRILAMLAFTANLAAQSKPEPEYEVKEHYTKYEYRIPMRDGVHLFTSIYVPKDTSRAYPFLINRTPCSVAPYGVDLYRTRLGPSPEFDKAGYIFVFQDVRGRYMSEGTFVEMRPHIDNKKSKQDVDDASDLYDAIDWLLKNVPNNNGNAGIWGISYPGFFTSASIIDSHPALKAASPQAPMTQGPSRGAYRLHPQPAPGGSALRPESAVQLRSSASPLGFDPRLRDHCEAVRTGAHERPVAFHARFLRTHAAGRDPHA